MEGVTGRFSPLNRGIQSLDETQPADAFDAECACWLLTVIGAIEGQPRYALISLGVPGIIMSIVFLAVLVRLSREYATAELRRMAAKEI